MVASLAYGETTYLSCSVNNGADMLISYKQEKDKILYLGGLVHSRKPQLMGRKDHFVYFIWKNHPENPNHSYTIERIEFSKKIIFIRSHVFIDDVVIHKKRKEEAKHNPYSFINPKRYKKVYNPNLLKLIPYRLKKNERAFAFDRDHYPCKRLSYFIYLLRIPLNILAQIGFSG